MTIKDTRIEKTYFRGHPKYGRTTTLVEVATGRILLSLMGVVGHRKTFRQWADRNPAAVS